MRGDQPLCFPASPTVSSSTTARLTAMCQRWRPCGRSWPSRLRGLGGRRALAAVGVLEPDDVVEMRRRDLEDVRVLERRHPVDGAGRVVERVAGADDLLLQHRVADGAELELR